MNTKNDVNILHLKIRKLEAENKELRLQLASKNNHRTPNLKKNSYASPHSSNNELISSEDDALSCITTFSYESNPSTILTAAFSKYMNKNHSNSKTTSKINTNSNLCDIHHEISTNQLPSTFTSTSDNDIKKSFNHNTKFIIQKELGRGVFGTVYLVKLHNPSSNAIYNATEHEHEHEHEHDKISSPKHEKPHMCAMKIVSSDNKNMNRETEIIRFLQKNKHENIVPFYKYCTEYEHQNGNKKTWIYMKYVPHTLSRICESMWTKKKKMSKDVHKNIMRQLACALQFIHHHNICHRDLKPDNILIDKSNMHLYLCDFGCSKFILPDNHLKNETYICSRFYRAPELIIDRNLYSTKIDVWSYGCIFIELCVSRILFMEKDNLSMLVSHIRLLGKITEIDIRSMSSTVSESDQFPVFPERESNWSSIFKKRTLGPEFEFLCPNILCFNINKRYTMTDILHSQYFAA